MRHSQGFSLIEVVVASAIAVILAGITFTAFINVNRQQALDKTRVMVIGILEQARSNSISSKNSQYFGVHVATSTLTLFEGTAYNSASATNTVFYLSSFVGLSSISLNGGGNDIIFGRLTGTTSNYGTIIYSLSTDSTQNKTVTVQPTGIIE